MMPLQSNHTLTNGKKHNHISTHFINAIYQGKLSENHQPQGQGIIVDDQFNIFISKWVEGQFSGHTFIKMNQHHILSYGEWKHGRMKGINVFKYQQLIIYASSNHQSHERWNSPLIAHNMVDDIVYVVDLEDNDGKNPHLKIRNRIINSQHNVILVAEVLKMNIKEHYLSPIRYLSFLTEIYSHFVIEQSVISQKLHYFGINPKLYNPALGMILNYNLQIKSIGLFNKRYELNGIGLCQNRDFHTLIGIFKEGILTKEFKEKNEPNDKKINVKECVRIENMKSIDYQHSVIHFPILIKIKHRVYKINQFIVTFQQLLKKHNNNNDDSLNQSNQNTIFTKKYEKDFSYKDKLDKNDTTFQNLQMENNRTEHQTTINKKPGFIYNKSKSKSKSKSPIKKNEKSPSQNKSPLFSPPKTFKKIQTKSINWKI